MENDKNKELDALNDSFNLDDDINELLSTNSSAQDALDALLYDKDSHSILASDSLSDDTVSTSSDKQFADDSTLSDLDIKLGDNPASGNTTASTPSNVVDDIDDVKVANEGVTLPEKSEAMTQNQKPAQPVKKETASQKPVKSVPEKPLTKAPAAKTSSKKTSSKGKKKSKKKKVNSSIFSGIILTIIILTISTVIAFTGITCGLEFLGIGKSTTTVKLNIGESYDVGDVTDALYDKGIIENKLLFQICVAVKDASDKIVAGDIELQPSMDYNDIINTLMTSRETLETVDITFPEGTTLYEAAVLLEENGVISSVSDFIYDFNSLKLGYECEDIIDSSSEKFFAMEGYFFPDTYQFYLDSENETVIDTIRSNFDSKFTDEMEDRAEELGFTVDEVITLASIVQLESASVEEMPTIASVFINRLTDGPYNRFDEYIAKLQSDPTSTYYSETITSVASELQNYTTAEVEAFEDKYDTYEREGLPVGAICHPGLDAINAVLYADETDYFYFCHDTSTKEGYFASTLEEHEDNLVLAGLS
ncbi:MAG: endolytic transglycosylase MltG [Ruminococcus sp.]|nr:endolytic transglycosylase MltG [Ruminococcus sp.]